MKINDLVYRYMSRESKPREIGRYWASDVGSIVAGYFGPKDFLSPKVVSEEGAQMMAAGQAFEDFLTKVLIDTKADFMPQAKHEIALSEEITLVVKVDYLFKDFAIETKFPFKGFTSLPERYLYQLECEYRVFGVPVYAGLFSLPYKIRLVGFTPDENRWEKIKQTLADFHQKVKKAEEKQSNLPLK